ncbi:MAG TPA: VanZ family protein [Lysobacter sp.]
MLREFHRPRLWLGVWIAAIVAVIVLSLIPPPPMPVPQGTDKVEHFLAYAVLSAYAAMLFVRRRTQAIVAVGLVGLGVGLEVAQATLTDSRMADSADALANTMGVLAGLFTAATPMAGWLQRVDRRLA